MKRTAVLIAVMALSACGHAPAVAHVATSPAATAIKSAPTATPSPGLTSSPAANADALGLAVPQCSGPIPPNRTLVLSGSISSADITLFDAGDPFNPKALCTISNADGARFLSATQIAYMASAGKASGGGIVKLDLSTGASSVVARWATGYGTAFAFSPNGQTLAYVVASPPSADFSGAGALTFHLLTSGNDAAVATLPGIPGRGGSESDDFMLAFSPDGAYVALVETFTYLGTGSQAPFQIRRPDGALIIADPPAPILSLAPRNDQQIVFVGNGGPHGIRTMAIWSGTGSLLFYRDPGGVYRWDPTSGATLVLPNVAWLRPQASPDGKSIAYTVRDSNGVPHVSLFDVASSRTTLISQAARSGGVYLTRSILWLQEEKPCGDQCGPGPPTIATGTDYLYDLATQQETLTQLGLVIDVWRPSA